jgi:hypothetical protein
MTTPSVSFYLSLDSAILHYPATNKKKRREYERNGLDLLAPLFFIRTTLTCVCCFASLTVCVCERLVQVLRRGESAKAAVQVLQPEAPGPGAAVPAGQPVALRHGEEPPGEGTPAGARRADDDGGRRQGCPRGRDAAGRDRHPCLRGRCHT